MSLPIEQAGRDFVVEPKLHAAPPIAGYRNLTQEEVDLINQIKEQGDVLSALVGKVNAFIDGQAKQVLPYSDEATAFVQAEPVRWIELARTNLQTGLMALTRAVAQPTNF